jgi:hypothetical protein
MKTQTPIGPTDAKNGRHKIDDTMIAETAAVKYILTKAKSQTMASLFRLTNKLVNRTNAVEKRRKKKSKKPKE